MYEIFEQLLQKYGVTAYKVSKETGVTQSTLSYWKKGRSTPKVSNLQKIADYFGVPLSYLLHGQMEEPVMETVLTPRDERDIAKDLVRIMSKLSARTRHRKRRSPEGAKRILKKVEKSS